MQLNCFRIPAFCLALALPVLGMGAPLDVSSIPARPAPEWLRSGTIYEIFPRDFTVAGDLNGVTQKLDELHALGVNILWTMPIHPIGEKFRKGEYGSPYSIKDYYAVDTNYGSLDDYRRLVSEAHKSQMKVIMDLVADHTAWDSVLMGHPEFYKHDAQGNIIPPVPEWTDVAALNYGDPELRRYMIAMLKYWIQTCDVDGFRCDAAAMVPTDFWESVRVELAGVKPDLMMLAEASKPELLTNAFDIDYSWPMLATVNDVLLHAAPASNIRRTWERDCAQFPKAALHLRISDDHDEMRAVGRYGLNGAVAASALVFTLDGVPLIYNGMEAGDTAESSGGALFEKRTVAWAPVNHPELRGTYHDLIGLRHQYAALRTPNVDWVHNEDETNLVTFLRGDDKDQLLVLINFANHPVTSRLVINNVSGFVPLKIPGSRFSQGSRLPAIQLNPYEWCIYHRPAIPLHPVSSTATELN